MNNWRRTREYDWTRFLFDVWKCYGVWFASFYVGQRFDREFRTAKEAKRYCDTWRDL